MAKKKLPTLKKGEVYIVYREDTQDAYVTKDKDDLLDHINYGSYYDVYDDDEVEIYVGRQVGYVETTVTRKAVAL